MITLDERINGCFKRSMNGKPLPSDSPDMKAMAAYFDWMKRETKPQDKVPGRGVGKIDRNIQPGPVNGKKVYADQCAVCHGNAGEGLRQADGRYVYLDPPLWGDASFNIGAGMARSCTAAASRLARVGCRTRKRWTWPSLSVTRRARIFPGS